MTASDGTWILFGILLLLPPGSVVAVAVWTRRLARRAGVPRFATWGASALVAVGTLIVVASVVQGLLVSTGAVSGERIDPSQRARILAEGISEAINCGAVALLVAVAAAVWLGFWTWRSRGKTV